MWKFALYMYNHYKKLNKLCVLVALSLVPPKIGSDFYEIA